MGENFLRNAVSFLKSNQYPDGKWTDFDLEVGCSTAWITAYVARALHREPQAKPNVRKACDWLLTNFRQGWGYNERVPIDCDSTAWGILALKSAEMMLPISGSELLKQFRNSDGLYQTFSGREAGDHWGDTHLDVSVIALKALLSSDPLDVDAVFQTAECIVELGEKGLWQAYWWNDQMYAVAHALESLAEVESWLRREATRLDEHCREIFATRITALKRIWRNKRVVSGPSSDPFEVALRLKVAVFTDVSQDLISEATGVLLSLQQPDGRWHGEKKLRVTNRLVGRPWEDLNSGPLFADINDVFTTAAVIDAFMTTGLSRKI
jgi:hypothetical protein